MTTEEERFERAIAHDGPVDKSVKPILDGDIRAHHKIEIHFGPNRRGVGEFKTRIVLLESGKFFHGGGDGNMYLCMDHRIFERDNTTPPSALPTLRKMMQEKRTNVGCGTPIPSSMVGGGVARCPGCKRLITSLLLTGEIPFYGTVGELAELTEILFMKLNRDADIYCKYHPTDIRYKTQAEFKGVEYAREHRGKMIYPLKNILRDTAAGASLVGRFRACFLA